jgi:hypothetical protein
MTLQTPPSWLQAGSYPAQYDRLTAQALYATTGIIGSSSMAVTANSPVGMSVRVASGWAAVVGTTTSNMGVYTAYNDATEVLTITTANPTNPRIDLVCLTIRDAYYSGASNDVIYQVIAGTPAGSPVAPALPANSISLATIAVGAAVTQINSGNITDTRVSTTTNLPVGDITEVQGGAGITVTSGTGPIPSVAINSTVATLTGSQTLTNKTLTTPIISTISNTGTLTLPTSTDTLVGRATTDTLTNKTLTAAVENNPILKSPEERYTVSATAATGTIAFDTQTQGVLYYTTNASGNFTLNFTNVNANLAVGDSISCVFLNTNGSTAYYATAFQIDSVAVTPKWSGGTAPSAGNASAIDSYSFTIIKTAATPTYTVLAGGAVKFA